MSEDIIEVSADNFLPTNSPSKPRSGRANTEINDNVIEYILEEIVPSEEDSECDLEALTNEATNIQYFEYSQSSEDEDASGVTPLEESLLPQSEVEQLSEQKSSSSEKKRSFKKKRKRNVDLWKANVKKRLRETGQSYVSLSNKMVAAKKLQPPCTDCSFKCMEVFTTQDRMNIFQSFWNMNDREKQKFYFKFITRNPIKRRRTQSTVKQFSYQYFFEKDESLIRVCQTFFLNTLCISRKRIYYCFKKIKPKVADAPPTRKNTKRVTRKVEEKVSNECTDFEYVVVEHVPDEEEEAVLSDFEFSTDSKDNSDNDHFDYPDKLSEDKAVVCPSKVINFSDDEDELIIPLSDLPPASEQKSNPLETKNTELLKHNLRKRLAKSNKSYVSKRCQKMVPAKILKPPCNDCILKCTIVFTDEDRLNIFQSFSNMTDDEKTSFYSKFIIRRPDQRQRSKSKATTKQFLFKYYLEKNDTMYRVCRTFFLNTLDITLRSIDIYFASSENKAAASTLPTKKGKNPKRDTRSSSGKKISANKFSPKKSKSESEAELASSEIEDNDYEYALEECDSDHATYSKKKSIKDSLYCPTSSEDESIVESPNKKMVLAKTLKPPCNDCIFKCINVFTHKERLNIFQSFSQMTDDERNNLFSRFLIRYPVQCRISKSNEITKQFWFKYFLEKNDSMYQVCCTFFLNTLGITSKIIDNYFENLKNKVSKSTPPKKKGKNAKQSKAPKQLSKVQERVSSIPPVDTHNSLSNPEKNVSPDKCLPKKSLTECRSELVNCQIEDKDIEYILEEIVSADEAAVSDEEESIKHYLDYPTLSEYEALVNASNVNNCSEEINSSQQKSSSTEKALDKKRKRDEDSWKCNVNKRLRESGQPYIHTTTKQLVPAKTLKPPCQNCIFSCTNIFNTEERMNIFQLFWKMTDDEKTSFYLKFVTRGPVQRRRTKSATIAKQFSFNYFFEKNESMYRVCRTFFTNTLDINLKRIYYCFKNLQDSGEPLPRKKGKNTKRVTAPNKLAEVREHITSISTVDSHGCRHVEAGFNFRKMYDLYLENYVDPVGLHIYRRVCKDEFNISFLPSQKRR